MLNRLLQVPFLWFGSALFFQTGLFEWIVDYLKKTLRFFWWICIAWVFFVICFCSYHYHNIEEMGYEDCFMDCKVEILFGEYDPHTDPIQAIISSSIRSIDPLFENYVPFQKCRYEDGEGNITYIGFEQSGGVCHKIANYFEGRFSYHPPKKLISYGSILNMKECNLYFQSRLGINIGNVEDYIYDQCKYGHDKHWSIFRLGADIYKKYVSSELLGHLCNDFYYFFEFLYVYPRMKLYYVFTSKN